ncbi:zinc ion binding / nucleic acid binding protein [Trifolium repens]|nr:zinc ion binding / nucleic acid binding protein [Trifolium repens]
MFSFTQPGPAHGQPSPAPSRPPESADHNKKKLSFRDKLLGNQEPIPKRDTVDLISKKLFRIEYEDGDRRRPKCYADDSVLKDLWLPWQHAVIVKLLGKNLGFFAMRDRLKAIWKLTGDMEMLDVGYGFFMIKFDLEADRDKVISGGPWMIYDNYVAIRPWTTDFISSQVKINKTLVWIRFPSLGLEYYDESLLLALASAVGTPVKVDLHTLDVSRGKFARVCIEIDLDKPVVGKVWFRDFWYHVEYEGLHLLCKCCGLYGHVARNCPTTIKEQENGHKNAGENSGNSRDHSAPVKTTAADASSANVSSLERPYVEARIKENELYGDWLVVDKKRNKGKKSRPKIQQEVTNIQGGVFKSLNGNNLTFSHLNEAGEWRADGATNHKAGPSFHPGGAFDSPKVWTKKNKRARGMADNITRPKSAEITLTSSQPSLKVLNPTCSKPERSGRIGGSTQPIILTRQSPKKNDTSEMVIANSRFAERPHHHGQHHLDPPDPDSAAIQHVQSKETAIDDEMGVESPASLA